MGTNFLRLKQPVLFLQRDGGWRGGAGASHLLLLLLGGLVVVDQPNVGLLEGQLGGEVAEVVVFADLAQDVLQDHLLLHRQAVLEDQHDVLLVRL